MNVWALAMIVRLAGITCVAVGSSGDSALLIILGAVSFFVTLGQPYGEEAS